jgi:hypothetical protein
MRRSIIAAAALALLTTTAAHAASKPIPFFKGKYWETYGVSSNSEGVPMCGMQATGEARSFFVKWTPTNGLIVQAWKMSWRLEEGSEVPLALEFVDNQNSNNSKTISTDAGRGVPSTNGHGSSVFMTVRDEDMMELLRVFGEADAMTVRFPAGDEPAWEGKMEGSR